MQMGRLLGRKFVHRPCWPRAGAQCRDKMWPEVMHVALSWEQLHRVIDDLPADKLAALADLIHTLIEEDDEPVGAALVKPV